MQHLVMPGSDNTIFLSLTTVITSDLTITVPSTRKAINSDMLDFSSGCCGASQMLHNRSFSMSNYASRDVQLSFIIRHDAGNLSATTKSSQNWAGFVSSDETSKIKLLRNISGDVVV